jgi:hypothetical protein
MWRTAGDAQLPPRPASDLPPLEFGTRIGRSASKVNIRVAGEWEGKAYDGGTRLPAVPAGIAPHHKRGYVVAMDRMAVPGDIDAICSGLPEVELGTSWGDRPTYKVPRGPKGRGFVMYRAPHKTAVDPDTGELYQDLLVIVVPDDAAKAALVEDPSVPFFTVPHFDGYNAVLVQESRLGEIARDELAEIIVEAWAARAPKKLAAQFFAGR